MRVLCVAEKPSIAKSITGILSGGQFNAVSASISRTRNNLFILPFVQRPTRNRYIKNYEFDYPQTRSHFTVTAVSGHLMSHDFEDMYRNWHSCDPFVLFEAPVIAKVSQDSKTIEDNLGIEARRADMLMIWTDCDREGENIGAEVAKICRRANRNIRVKRARFSAIIPQCVWRRFPLRPVSPSRLLQANPQCRSKPHRTGPGASRCGGSEDGIGSETGCGLHSDANAQTAIRVRSNQGSWCRFLWSLPVSDSWLCCCAIRTSQSLRPRDFLVHYSCADEGECGQRWKERAMSDRLQLEKKSTVRL